MSIPVTIYKRPLGHTETIHCTEIAPEDEAWFKEHNAELSMEEAPGMGFTCYADVGIKDKDGEPVEAIEISGRRTCEETLAALRQQCERMLANKEN